MVSHRSYLARTRAITAKRRRVPGYESCSGEVDCERTQRCYSRTDVVRKHRGQVAEERITRVLEGIAMGGQKPSAFLSQIQQLAGGNISEDVIKVLWTQPLPPSVRDILSVSQELNLVELAELGDKIHVATRVQL
ncbi:transposition [Cordylochernes scorpioides]|uniref:Transposition n=1 Tax=Cordylochernes scorpioides TaxID=51811 RepID=A0ABY6KGY3_9ARAC|nr:transposition [Cordylochernes scorpioides]